MSTLHSEPLPTDEAELFAESSLRCIRTFSMCSHKKRLSTCLLIMSLTMKFTLRMTRRLPIATSTHFLAELGLLHEFLDDMLGKGFF